MPYVNLVLLHFYVKYEDIQVGHLLLFVSKIIWNKWCVENHRFDLNVHLGKVFMAAICCSMTVTEKGS